MPTLEFKGRSVIQSYHYTVQQHSFELSKAESRLPKGEKPSLSGNLIIEGDNLIALKSLLPSHSGKIKCAYIDPPYNTGAEHWVYNDNVNHPIFRDWIRKEVGNDAEDATRHDKWCCMMYPRLTLLRELLREDGSLFVSIDENEHGHLRLLLDEIFRTDKPLGTFVWRRRSATGMRADPVSTDQEYVLLYAKNPAVVDLHGLVMTADQYPYMDEKTGQRYASTDLSIGADEEDRPNQFYPIKNPRTGTIYEANPERVWRFEKPSMEEEIANDKILWPDDFPESEMKRPRYKTFFDPVNPKIKPVSTWIVPPSTRVQQSGDEEDDVATITSGLNSEGGRVLRRIFGKKVFEYPKPPSLLRSLVRLATTDGDIVLDAFAGSGTTGQAVLELNHQDGKKRNFILIQRAHDNSKQESAGLNVCREITAKRIEAVMDGYAPFAKGKKQKTKVEGLGGSFTYAKIGKPLFGEYRQFASGNPSFEELASYIVFTESGEPIDPKLCDETTGLIARTSLDGGTSYYLLYSPDGDINRELSSKTLEQFAKDTNRVWVIYCERLWIHPEDLRAFAAAHGKVIRPMLVPFNLK